MPTCFADPTGRTNIIKDSDLEKLYSYLRFLLTKIPRDNRGPVYHFEDDVNLKYYRLHKISEGSIKFEKEKDGKVSGPTEFGAALKSPCVTVIEPPPST